MNYTLHGSFTPFERGRADCNLLAGALGVTMTTEGDIFKLAGINPETPAMRWALKRHMEHPLSFAAAFVRRCAAAISWHWFLWLLSGAALLRFRNDGVFQSAGILLLYWMALYCATMPVRPDTSSLFCRCFWL